jgi:beta-N-acetylhexosaminidase
LKLSKYSYRIIVLIIFVFIFSFFEKSTGNPSSFTSDDDEKYPSVFPLSKTDKEWIEIKISGMSLREKCAQMIMAPVYRSYMDTLSPDYDSTVALVRDYKIGGLIMFQGELEQEINFIREMQLLSDVPLLIASDYERGLGTRIDDALEFPHSMALGATLNSQLSYELGKAIAIESRLIGVHQNFAPVTDINNNPLNPVINTRSFSESKFTVSQFVSSFILGTKHNNVIATAKHFPGHGNTEIDSHTDLPMISGNKQKLFENELYPFIQAIKSGVQSVMVGHLEVPAYDTLPATLSETIIKNLLINTLGFDGLIVTDAMNMNAITNYNSFSPEEIVVLSVKAGNDIVLMPPEPSAAINAIYSAVINGEISEERIEKSVRKILAAKRWLNIGTDTQLNTQAVIDSINNFHFEKLADQIAEKSITLIKNEASVIPLNLSKYKKVSCITITDGNGNETATYFQDKLSDRFGNIEEILITNKTRNRGYKSALSSLNNSDLILMPVFMEVKEQEGKEKIRREQFRFIKKVLRLKAPVVLISFKNPYLLSSFPVTRSYLNAYSYTPASQDASLKAILGETDITGKLPVSIPDTKFHIGNGLELKRTIITRLTYPVKDQNDFLNLEDLFINSVKDNQISNANISVGYKREIVYQKKFGKIPVSSSENQSRSTQYNIGELSEPIALTSAVMILVDDGVLSVDDKVYYYLNEFTGNGKENITVKNLLLHNSGIGREIKSMNVGWSKDDLVNALMNLQPEFDVNQRYNHSDLNSLLLQLVIEKITETSLADFLNNRLFQPLGMINTFFKPNLSTDKKKDNFTSLNQFQYGKYISQKELINSIMNGVTLYDGLWSTNEDISVFSQMLIQDGYYGGKQIITAATVKYFTSPQLPDSYEGLTWQTYISQANVCDGFSNKSFGYNTNDGSSLWIDPVNKLFIVLLTDTGLNYTDKLVPKVQCEIINIILNTNHESVNR